jgi:hypothetical protein
MQCGIKRGRGATRCGGAGGRETVAGVTKGGAKIDNQPENKSDVAKFSGATKGEGAWQREEIRQQE